MKGIKYATACLPLMFLGPTVIHSSLKNKGHDWFEIVLGAGILICLTAVFLLFYGIRIIVKAIFND